MSASLIASGYCSDTETLEALERQDLGDIRVVPVLIRTCDWRVAAFAHCRALPESGVPVDAWKDRNEAWLDIIKSLRRLIAQVNFEGMIGNIYRELKLLEDRMGEESEIGELARADYLEIFRQMKESLIEQSEQIYKELESHLAMPLGVSGKLLDEAADLLSKEQER